MNIKKRRAYLIENKLINENDYLAHVVSYRVLMNELKKRNN